MDSRRVGPTIFVALLSSAGWARAEVRLPGADLSVHSPPSMPLCVEESSLAELVRSQLSIQAQAPPESTPLRLEVTVQKDWSKLVADLRVSGRSGGQRQIEAARCTGLKDALAVTIALILDQDVRDRQPSAVASAQPNAAPLTATAAAVAATPPVAAAPSTTDSRPQPQSQPRSYDPPAWRGFSFARDVKLRAWAGLGYGSSERLKAQGFRLETGLQVSRRNWGLLLGGYWQPSHELALGDGHLSLMSFGGLIAGCHAMGDDWRVQLCLQASLGAQRLRTDGLGEKSPSPQFVFYAGPRIGVETETAALAPTSGTRWIAGIDMLAQSGYFRDKYVIDNSNVSVDAPLIGFWLIARLALSTR